VPCPSRNCPNAWREHIRHRQLCTAQRLEHIQRPQARPSHLPCLEAHRHHPRGHILRVQVHPQGRSGQRDLGDRRQSHLHCALQRHAHPQRHLPQLTPDTLTADQVAARTLTQVSIVPSDLVTFYDSIGDVTWADAGNGYFVDPAADALLRFKQYGAVDVGADQKDGGLVIGSNGDGLSYVASPGGVIYRTRTASLDQPELDRVADDLRRFLELLERSLTRFVAKGESGCL
jgi:hypothetical protein